MDKRSEFQEFQENQLILYQMSRREGKAVFQIKGNIPKGRWERFKPAFIHTAVGCWTTSVGAAVNPYGVIFTWLTIKAGCIDASSSLDYGFL